ncbi:hypothetical protein P4493_05815 [Bacillus thuringiensis]|uniref:Uncharacterized protein n=3 Tax=Bacillus thuringiensis TaxID=1428 RepID=A0A7D4D0Q2_BACTU|nr:MULTISPECIES: hypothetical protein [Bacillus]MEC2533079.1 hypothetical protein [Bacillus cereus]MED1153941.1 hypothetical protein [Bacillus paranthracis]OUB09219.1 hypothetical protein BK708_32300 [Bacillus thuringiensis serovar yunnanensis]AFQ29813.1 hypothetical protein BTF1_28562 [Bacillus thuringiensis HD-789]AND28191.1 hypothetical protein ATN07_31305 [Bacillus thuringiensis serovar israelensis]
MIIQMNYELVDSELKLKGGKVTDNKENVFFSASSKYAMRKFLELTGIELKGRQTLGTVGETYYTSTMLDREFVFKPYKDVDELNVTLELERVITYVDGILVDGFLEVQGKTLIIHHISKEVGTDYLEEQRDILLSRDLGRMLHFHVPNETK